MPELGVSLLRGFGGDPSLISEISITADRLGYHSVWVNEHIVVPVQISSRYPYTPDGRPHMAADLAYPEAVATLAFVAGITSRIRLATGVIPLFSRDPLSLAKQAATIDVLSGGRLELGLGAGWMVEEAQLLGHPSDHRGERLDEAIEILRKVWSQSTTEHHGRFYSFAPLGVHPQPVHGADVPIWIGGTSPAAIRTTLRHATGNFMWNAAPDAVQSLATLVRQERPELRIAVSTPVGLDVELASARIDALFAAGADLAVLVPDCPLAAFPSILERMAATFHLPPPR
jgi:probable F420-dependent oxidoreductase